MMTTCQTLYIHLSLGTTAGPSLDDPGVVDSNFHKVAEAIDIVTTHSIFVV